MKFGKLTTKSCGNGLRSKRPGFQNGSERGHDYEQEHEKIVRHGRICDGQTR